MWAEILKLSGVAFRLAQQIGGFLFPHCLLPPTVMLYYNGSISISVKCWVCTGKNGVRLSKQKRPIITECITNVDKCRPIVFLFILQRNSFTRCPKKTRSAFWRYWTTNCLSATIDPRTSQSQSTTKTRSVFNELSMLLVWAVSKTWRHVDIITVFIFQITLRMSYTE